MSTEITLNFLLEHYKKNQKNNLLIPEEWNLLKKYKNTAGNTCRDFYHKKTEEQAIVMTDKITEKMIVLESMNFLSLMEMENIKPLYLYAPFLSNQGLTFLFALYKPLKDQKILTMGNERLAEALMNKLNSIFINNTGTNKDIIIRKENMILITNYDTNIIVEKLEQNNFKFDSEIFNYFQNSLYQPIYPDILDLKYHFPQDQEKTSEEALDTIFSTLSKNDLTDESYTRTRKLLRRLTLELLNVSKKIVLDIKPKETQKLSFLLNMEIKRRKLKNLIG